MATTRRAITAAAPKRLLLPVAVGAAAALILLAASAEARGPPDRIGNNVGEVYGDGSLDGAVLWKQRQQRRAWEVLADAGITGLCHPNRDDFGPLFPRCSASNGDSPTGTRGRDGIVLNEPDRLVKHRVLEEDGEADGADDDNANNNQDDDEEEEQEEEPRYSFSLPNFIGALFCVICSALASGLSVGLLSLDPLVLMIKSRAVHSPNDADDDCDGAAAAKAAAEAKSLLPIVRQHHLLMVTLLLVNTASSEALPMFLNDLVPELVAVLISVVLVFLICEILPSAIFTGSSQIALAAKLAGLVKFLMWVLYPIAFPVAKLLDCIMSSSDHGEASITPCAGSDDDGHLSPGGTLYSRGELAAMIRIQYEQRAALKRRHTRRQQAVQESVGRFDDGVEMEALQSSLNSSIRDIRNHMRRSSSIHIDEV